MPIFEYECLECGKKTEKLQINGDGPLEVCPQCGGNVTKLISAPMIQFKGSGWYITDYQNKEKKKSETANANGKSIDGNNIKSSSGAA
jgi:putative FmdB family regulatory protein